MILVSWMTLAVRMVTKDFRNNPEMPPGIFLGQRRCRHLRADAFFHKRFVPDHRERLPKGLNPPGQIMQTLGKIKFSTFRQPKAPPQKKQNVFVERHSSTEETARLILIYEEFPGEHLNDRHLEAKT